MSIQQAPGIAATRWRIDPTHSSVEFHVKYFWGIATVKGGFSRFHGTLDLTADPAIELTIEADSLDTGHAKRDAHLRSRDYFDVENHPYVRFVSDRAVLEGGERLTARGHLHARGESIALTVEATLRRTGNDLQLEAVSTADHHALGMTYNMLGSIAGTSKLIVKGRLERDA
jgi:polyisoprenoid-binding protein YceI